MTLAQLAAGVLDQQQAAGTAAILAVQWATLVSVRRQVKRLSADVRRLREAWAAHVGEPLKNGGNDV